MNHDQTEMAVGLAIAAAMAAVGAVASIFVAVAAGPGVVEAPGPASSSEDAVKPMTTARELYEELLGEIPQLRSALLKDKIVTLEDFMLLKDRSVESLQGRNGGIWGVGKTLAIRIQKILIALEEEDKQTA